MNTKIPTEFTEEIFVYWVKGYAYDNGNEVADFIAKEAT